MMPTLNLPCLCGLVVMAVLLPTQGRTQTIAQSFSELQKILKPGELVVVTDEGGRETTAKIGEVLPSSLMALTRETTRDSLGTRKTWTARRTFAEAAVSHIRRTDSSRNGGLIGLAAGVAGAALWLVGPCATGSDEYLRVCAGPSIAMVVGGSLAGVAIDNKIGNELVYRAPSVSRRSVASSLSPSLAGRRGLSFSVRF